MELYSHTEVCRIVEQCIKKFMEWEGYIPRAIDDIWESFTEEGNIKVRFEREIMVEEINVEDLDDNGTA